MTSYAHRAVRGVVSVFALSVLGGIVTYLVRLLFARELSVDGYGLFYAVFGFITFFTIFKDFGLLTALSKQTPEFSARRRANELNNAAITVLLFQLAFSLLIGLLLLIFSSFLTTQYFRDPAAMTLLWLLVFYFLFSIVVDWISALFIGMQMLTTYALLNLGKMLAILLLALWLFRLHLGVLAPAVAYLLMPPLMFLFFFPRIQKRIPQLSLRRFSFDGKLVRSLFRFGLPVALMSSGGILLITVDTVMLTYFSTLEQVGLYNVAVPTVSILLYLSYALTIVLLPLISEMMAKGDVAHLEPLVQAIHRYSLLIVVPVSLAVFFFPELVINLLFGAKYLGAVPALRILAIGTIFTTLANINLTILLGVDEPLEAARTVLFGAFANIVCNLVLIPRYGIAGASVATAASFFLTMVLSYRSLRNKLRISVPLRTYVLTFFAGGFFISSLFLAKRLFAGINPYTAAIVGSLLAFMLYLGVAFVFRLFSLKEARELLVRR
jgi:O-antigen/teichoic acid export membrane protein